MAKLGTRSLRHFLLDARRALGMTQRTLGGALGSSHRTVTRWDGGRSTPADFHLHRLAALLMPIDVDLAEEAAAFGGRSLEDLGLRAAPPPPPAPPAPPPPPAPLPQATSEDLVDIVVCAAAEATDVSPRALRPTLYAAFRRARQIGLTVEAVEEALARSAVGERRKKRPTSAQGPSVQGS